MMCRRNASRSAFLCTLSLLLAPNSIDALRIISTSGNYHCRRGAAAISPIHRHSCISNNQLHTRNNRVWIDNKKSSALFSSPQNGLQLENAEGDKNNGSSSSNNNNKSPKKWQRPIQSLRRAILSILTFFLTLPARFRSYYGKLTKKGKILLGIQLLAFGALLGTGYKTSTAAKTRAAARPVEVSYSTFLDLVDVNGKGHIPGKHPALKLENVVISKDRVGFRVVTDAEKHAAALLDKKLVKEDDVSVREIPLSQKTIYAMKPPASADLIDALREHEVPFRAASTKTSN
eukprot:CAMPEP_0183732692 /NCGR_PEP_ID=MMETSP0737-20130205/39110_1 /TAXON_ID=385413 /ORGANISM="Thalassiosira miniscula, Strain CCMP1093" /LENGTH=288 /DNA_ID=CAMNT_0025965769 /DNA_START=119 /DNA_END=982 /DNA_ORIENTATION=-